MAKETPSELDLVSLKNLLEQLARKKSILKELDQKIAALLEDPAELEKEIFDTEVIQEDIDETSSQISNFIHHSLSVKKSPPSTSQSNTSNQGTPPVVTLDSENAQAPPGLYQTLVRQGPQHLKKFLMKQPLTEPFKPLKFPRAHNHPCKSNWQTHQTLCKPYQVTRLVSLTMAVVSPN